MKKTIKKTRMYKTHKKITNIYVPQLRDSKEIEEKQLIKKYFAPTVQGIILAYDIKTLSQKKKNTHTHINTTFHISSLHDPNKALYFFSHLRI